MSRLRNRGTALLVFVAILTVVLAVLIGAGFLGAGALGPLAAEGAPQAQRIKTLYLVTLAIGVVVFVIVEGTLIWALVRDRYRRGAPAPRQIRGNTRLEVGWTIGAALILVVIAIVTFAMLPGIANPPDPAPAIARTQGVQVAQAVGPPPAGGDRLNVRVVGQQYIWRHDYPGGVYSFFEMVVPTNTTIILDITSTDVIHSYWIPKLFGKKDAIPGHVNRHWFRISRPGVYYGNCAELCGENHAQMVQQVRALPPDEYRAWYVKQRQGIREAAAYLALTRRLQEGDTEPPQAGDDGQNPERNVEGEGAGEQEEGER